MGQMDPAVGLESLEAVEWESRIEGHGYEDPAQILAHPFNARFHPTQQAEAMEAILRTIGWVDTVKINVTTQHLVDGHLRVLRALQKGQKRVPVTYVRLSESEERIILLTFNAIGMLAVVDADKVRQLRQGLEIASTQIQAIVQHSAARAQHIAAAYGSEQGPGGAGETSDAKTIPARVEPGDLWTIGPHRLVCGDALDPAARERLLHNTSPKLAVMDPPYGMRLNPDFTGVGGLSILQPSGISHGGKYDPTVGDDQDYNAGPMFEVLESVPDHIWFGADYYASTIPGGTEHSGSWFVWDKRITPEMDRGIGSSFELIWSRQKRRREILRYQWSGVFGMAADGSKRRLHANQKPIALIEDLIRRLSQAGDVVVDFYGGSGTTVIAAARSGREARVMELVPSYCDAILYRAEQEGLPIRLVDRLGDTGG